MDFELRIETHPEQKAATLRLVDADGVQRGYQQVSFPDQGPAFWEGLFDTRRFVRRYTGGLLWDGQTVPATAEALLERLGAFLGQQVLGTEILQQLAGWQHRTLTIHLPAAADDVIAAALTRVPWEIARPAVGSPPLMGADLVVRAVTDDVQTGTGGNRDDRRRAPPADPLRVLLVFAEAPGSRPLAMRLERERLLSLFYGEILPRRRVEVDVLCHGVTRQRLEDMIRARGGYQVLHWSGHGNHNLLELRTADGRADHLTGGELLQVISQAGGFAPQLVFLSACLSGTLVDAKDWAQFRQAMLRDAPVPGGGPAGGGATKDQIPSGSRDLQERQLHHLMQQQPGYTGTALALLAAGVPQVVAMRYEVGDDYARELARAFYRHLLADPAGHSPETALALARGELFRQPDQSAFSPVDHCTPLFFGNTDRPLVAAHGASRQMERCSPKPWPLLSAGSRELDPAPPQGFVGRGAELSRLAERWLPRPSDAAPAAGAAVAVVQGLAGLGKTSLAAEGIHLWHGQFKYVLCFQAKPMPLQVDEFLRQVDFRLANVSPEYRERCEQNERDRVYLPVGTLPAEQRDGLLFENLIQVLRNEAVLLVLDNWETNLEPQPTAEHGYRARDPRWDRLLERLSAELPATRSRLLVTTRHRPAALADASRVEWLPLGPLPPAEAGLYVRAHDDLRALYFSGGDEGRELVERLLRISRGHPLILDRLARLAADRPTLAAVLDQLETGGLSRLADLFAATGHLSDADRERERQYLEDVAVGSIDLLLQRLSPDACRLLWVISLANEPAAITTIESVWAGPDAKDDKLEELRAMVKVMETMPEEMRKQMPQIPPKLRELLGRKQDAPATPPVEPLLDELRASGLVTRTAAELSEIDWSAAPPELQAMAASLEKVASDAATFGCHELVRERVAAWMEAIGDQRGTGSGGDLRSSRGIEPLTPGPSPRSTGARGDFWGSEQDVWVAYGERYAAQFNRLYESGQPNARLAAFEVGRRALSYLVRARAFDRLRSFAGTLVTSTNSPALLRGIIDDLQSVADQVPPGKDRWSLRTYLAAAIDHAGQPDQSLTLYQQAAAEAEAAEYWSDVATISNNWANSLYLCGQLDASRAKHVESAEATRKAGDPEVGGVGRELEALRIDVMQGRAEAVLPEIESRLDRVRQWWQETRAGQLVPAAPNAVTLGRALISSLDTARQANHALERWQACLDLLGEIEEIEKQLGESPHELAINRFNQYGPLIRLGRLDDAQQVLEQCLAIFRDANDLTCESAVLSALAEVWDKRGDTAQAADLVRQALAVRNRLPNPSDRAASHNNLAKYLEKLGRTDQRPQHDLAAVAYWLCAGHGALVRTWLPNLTIRIRRAAAAGRRYELPRLADLLAQSPFAPLATWLAASQIDLDQLQARIDQLVDQTRQQAS